MHFHVAHSIAHSVTLILSMMVYSLIYFIEAVFLYWIWNPYNNLFLYPKIYGMLLTS